MANLRGSSFNKQIKDAYFRMQHLRESRHNKEVKGFVSLNRLKQAKTILNKFSKYLQAHGINSGKLNEYLSNVEIVKDFASKEIFNKNYEPSTVKEYSNLFAKTLQNLSHNNVTISPEAINYAKELYSFARENFKADGYETGRYINDLPTKLNNLYEKNFASGVIAEIQYTTGLRISEAYELVKNFNNYYNHENNTIERLIGKANHEYSPKQISYDLVLKIKALHNNNIQIPSQSTYRADLKEVEINKSHDLRITYAKNTFYSKIAEGKDYKEALRDVSKELNHHREEMTKYYLARA